MAWNRIEANLLMLIVRKSIIILHWNHKKVSKIEVQLAKVGESDEHIATRPFPLKMT